MDNPEYILQESKKRSGGGNSGNYHTLGIPVVPSPTSSSGPPSLPSAPAFTSLSSTGSSNYAGLAPATAVSCAPPSSSSSSSAAPVQAGLNGALGHRVAGGGGSSHPRSSDGESDHDYYNDVDRLKREMQPLQQPPRNETTV